MINPAMIRPASLKSRILKGERLITDGAMGTSLIAMGSGIDQSTALLNVTHPQWVESVHQSYIQAGADIILTNTFGASPARLAAFGIMDRTPEINRAALDLARKAASPRSYVAFSCGPSGLNDESPQTMLSNYREQFADLDLDKVDVVLIETMIGVAEALAATQAAREKFNHIPIAVSFAFQMQGNEVKTLKGESVTHVVSAMKAVSADIIGTNCGRGISETVVVANRLKDVTDLPLMIRPSAGLPQKDPSGRFGYPESPEFFEPYIHQLWTLGVNIIGGCCGTVPDHIRVMRASKSMIEGEWGSHEANL